MRAWIGASKRARLAVLVLAGSVAASVLLLRFAANPVEPATAPPGLIIMPGTEDAPAETDQSAARHSVTPQWELARIHAHLARVEQRLRARDVSSLAPAQRQARAGHLDVLREYREARRYPHNHDRPGELIPYFVDEHGTLCAMAYLIARSGNAALVERVAATRNNARIAELVDEPELIEWLDAAGLTAEEAALIQPMYDWNPTEPEPEPVRVSGDYALASAAATGLTAAAVIWNLPARSTGQRWPGVFGVVTGATGLALGAAKLDDDRWGQRLGLWNAAAGTLAVAVGLRTLLAGQEATRATSETNAEGPGRDAAIRAGPLLAPSGQAGVGITISF